MGWGCPDPSLWGPGAKSLQAFTVLVAKHVQIAR